MLVLVTGANGNIGSAVVARFARDGHRVRALVRGVERPPASDVVRTDLTDRDGVFSAARGVDLAVHCAAAVSDDWEECRRVNVQGTKNLVDALLASGSPLLVHLSTLSAYDDAGGPNYDEDSLLWTEPQNPYGFTKAEAERVVRGSAARGLPAVILRLTLVLSMHRRSRWGPLAVARARASASCLVPFPELPYVHVDNVVEAIALAARLPAPGGRSFNVIDGVADTREYLDVVYAAAGRATLPVPPGAPRLTYASERIRRELGWAPVDRWREFLQQLRLHGAR